MKLKNIITESLTEFGQINEASLSRLVDKVKNNDFCVASAFRSNFTKKQNRQRNKELFSVLQSKKMGGYVLIAHWQEAPDGTDWKDASPEQLQDITEESVLFIKPESVSREEFIEVCVSIANKFNQDAVIVGLKDKGIFLYYKSGDSDQIGQGTSIGKISQAYSQLRSGNKTPFVFEGSLQPTSNFGRMAFSINNILYFKS
jgi:hypothetical protein